MNERTDFNLFDPDLKPEIPQIMVISRLVGDGFGCSMRSFETGEERVESYFKSHRDNPMGHFWLCVGLKPGIPNKSGQAYVCVTLGDIDRTPQICSEIVDGERQMWRSPNRFEWDFRPRYIFLNGGIAPGGSAVFRACFASNPIPADTRERLARGLYWMGAPFDFVQRATDTELTAHQVSEWRLQRRELCQDLFTPRPIKR
jgi:hypothetical protein